MTDNLTHADPMELVWLPAGGGEVRWVASAADIRGPHFTADPQRIYFNTLGGSLSSMRFDGSDRRTHLRLDSNLGVPKPSLMHPGGRWALAKLASIRLGRVSVYTFKSRTGVEWYGGLFLPPNYVQGQRYPLVISTHGFDKKAFTLYGDERVAMAAQPMAAQGFVVLQLQNPPLEVGVINPKEAPEEMAAYEAAIDALDEAGLIDRTKVGLIAFSRSGTPVRYALAHSTYAFEAAIIAEGNHCAFSNYFVSEMWANWTERCIGAPPYGAGLDVWRKESPSFTFDRVRTPLRLEYHNVTFALVGEWEYYNNLRHLGKPVEFFLMPEGSHQNNKTHHAYASMQGAVEWMNFWLKGYEDKDPAKREQYARWHVLRARRDAAIAK